MQMLYMTTAGSSDPTRASIPLHLAVNGSLEVGHEVGVVLAGDATELLKASVRDRLEGVGVPPVRDLFAKARQHEVPVYV
jgi:predicted peroxiredoxin